MAAGSDALGKALFDFNRRCAGGPLLGEHRARPARARRPGRAPFGPRAPNEGVPYHPSCSADEWPVVRWAPQWTKLPPTGQAHFKVEKKASYSESEPKARGIEGAG